MGNEINENRWNNTSDALADFRESTKTELDSGTEKFIDNFLECAKNMSESAKDKLGVVVENLVKFTLKEADKFDSTVLMALPFAGIAAGAAYVFPMLPHPNESMYLVGNITSGQWTAGAGILFASIGEAIALYSYKSKKESKQNEQ